mgnify:CR=1 FL=1
MDNPISFLHSALCKLSEGTPLKKLQQDYQKISQSYKHSNFSLPFSPSLCLSYAMARMPATLYAQIKVWKEFEKEISNQDTSFSLVDLGSGPGTSLWALAKKNWVKKITLMEKSTPFIDLSKQLATANNYVQSSHFKVKYLQGDISTDSIPSADIVLASYCLNELPDKKNKIKNIWQAAKQYIVLIEPGTPENFQKMLSIRNFFISHGATIVAPCPGNIQCPLEKVKDTWCHFRTKLPRHKNHIYIKSAKLPFEEEPYFYLIAKKNKSISTTSVKKRIISAVRKTKIEASTLLCTQQGLEKFSISKKEKLYKLFIKKHWGDTL